MSARVEKKQNLGTRLSGLLAQRGMSQKKLAKLSGLTETAVSRYANNSRVPNSAAVAKMARVLGTTTDYLLSMPETEDAEQAYWNTMTAIGRYASEWSPAQKTGMVEALFKKEEE